MSVPFPSTYDESFASQSWSVSSSSSGSSSTGEVSSYPLQFPLGLIDSTVQLASEIEDEFLTTGCRKLDAFLHGGIPCFGVTEICGPSGVAKTQLCLQLALCVHLPSQSGGLNACAFYITTESAFPTKRLAELSEQFSLKYGFHSQENPMDNIIVENTPDRDSLFRCLNVRLPALIKEKGKSSLRLIIVDSLAAVFRVEYDDKIKDSASKRAQDLRTVGIMLNEFARDLKAAVVVVNQATTCLSTGQTIPALGLAWTNMVTTRLQLNRITSADSVIVKAEGFFDRSIEILFAPHLPNNVRIGIALCSAGLYADDPIFPHPVYQQQLPMMTD